MRTGDLTGRNKSTKKGLTKILVTFTKIIHFYKQFILTNIVTFCLR